MRVFTTIPQADLKDVPAAAKAIEADGYDGVSTMENRHDPFLPLAVAAVNTSRLQLNTGITIAFARSPMVVANQGWDLQRASGGRFVVGLGSQVKGHIERRFSSAWTAPARRMREYVEALRAIWRCWESGGPLDYQGECYNFSLMTPHFRPEPLETPPPAITIAAVGPAMMRVAGNVCDGVRLHPFCTRKYLEEGILPRLAAALDEVGRARASFEIVGGGFLATGPDDATVDKLLQWVRQRVGFYGSTRAYWPVFEAHGLQDLGLKLNRMARDNQWAEMTAEVPEDVARMFAAVGRHDEIAQAIAERFGGLSDGINTSSSSEILGDLPPDLIQDIQRIDTPFQNYAA